MTANTSPHEESLVTCLFSCASHRPYGTEIARLRKHKVHVVALTSETSKSEKREVGLLQSETPWQGLIHFSILDHR